MPKEIFLVKVLEFHRFKDRLSQSISRASGCVESFYAENIADAEESSKTPKSSLVICQVGLLFLESA